MQVDGQELTEYIDTILNSIEKSLNKNDKFYISPQDKIIVELAIVNTKKVEGGIKISVAKSRGRI